MSTEPDLSDRTSPLMTQNAAAPWSLALGAAFEANEFDIAGLADLPTDADTLCAGLRDAYAWASTSGTLRGGNQLARAMFVLIRVAQEDYGAEGAASLWPHFSARMRDALPPGKRPYAGWCLSPQQQAEVGDWFRRGLKHFGYCVPRDQGRIHVDPIVFHAGVPHHSLPGLVRVIADACADFGEAASEFEPAAIADVVAGDDPRLHRNIARMLRSRMRGVSQLWGAIARVVYAWRTRGEAEEEFRQLPASLDAVAVRRALADLDRSPSRVQVRPAAPLPVLRYDPYTGSVRVWVPEGQATDWRITAGRKPIPVVWDRLPAGLSAQTLGPLSETVAVSRDAGGVLTSRQFTVRPSRWPGLWFRASTGLLEQGATIDASGLEPGRWFVLFEGSPDGADPSARRPLDWAFFPGGRGWTAWEVEVPPRDEQTTQLVWRVGTNEFVVELARRPGPRLAVSAASAEATGPQGERFLVYASAPCVTLERDRPVDAVIVRRCAQPSPVGLVLLPGKPTRLPADRAGVYRLQERHGFGRRLLDFAVIPRFASEGPAERAETNTVVLTVRAAADAGKLDPAVSVGPGTWRLSADTVEPMLRAAWRWAEPGVGDLEFAWPVRGLRWRVLGLGADLARWTRSAIEIKKQEVAAADARLELNIPTPDLCVNGGPPVALDPTPYGHAGTLDLMPHLPTEFVRLTTGGADFDAVYFSLRPLLDALSAELVGSQVRVRWKPAAVRPGTVLLAWNPVEPDAAPAVLPLDAGQAGRGEAQFDRGRLPVGEFLSITLATPRTAGFSSAPSYQWAVQTRDLRSPVCRLLVCRPARPQGAPDPEQEWADVAHQVLVGLENNLPPDVAAVMARLQSLAGLPWTSIRRFARAIWIRFGTRAEFVTAALRALLNERAADIAEPITEDWVRRFLEWLREGFHLGWSPAQRREADTVARNPAEVYPLGYFADLEQLGYTAGAVLATERAGVGSAQSVIESLKSAARRVVDYHAACDLPWPGLVLPWRVRQAEVYTPGDVVRKVRFEKVYGEENLTAEQFAVELGYEDLAIDASAVDDRPARELRSMQTFELNWEIDRREWVMERRWSEDASAPRVPRRFRPDGFRVHCPAAVELGRRLELRQRLVRWGALGHAPPAAVGDLPGKIEAVLRAEPATGPLHADIFTPPRVDAFALDARRFTILGGPKAIHRQSAEAIPPVVLWAWGLAWIDRLAARRGGARFFESGGPLAGLRSAVLTALATALESHPDLMRRCLACADFMARCLIDGGIGMAARFSPSRKANG